jgi:acyl carrier protein
VSSAEETLIRCFRATFPDLPAKDLPGASVDTLKEWDSLHAVILIAVLEEAYALRIPSQDYPALRSYASVREYLSLRAGRLL